MSAAVANMVTPVRSVDRTPIGSGRRGIVTRRLQEEFFAIVSGEAEDRHGWLTPVPASPASAPYLHAVSA